MPRKTFDFLAARDFISCPGVDTAAQCDSQLCGEYCGPMHYACARVCDVYQKSTCGPQAAALDESADWDREGCSAVPPRASGGAGASAEVGGASGSAIIPQRSAPGPTTPPVARGCGIA